MQAVKNKYDKMCCIAGLNKSSKYRLFKALPHLKQLSSKVFIPLMITSKA
jgi:hypothetical protein